MPLTKFFVTAIAKFPLSVSDTSVTVLVEASKDEVRWEDLEPFIAQSVLPKLLADAAELTEVRLVSSEVTDALFERLRGEAIEVPTANEELQGVKFFRCKAVAV